MRYPVAFGSSLASILREPCSRSLAIRSSSLAGGCAPTRDAQSPGVCVRTQPGTSQSPNRLRRESILNPEVLAQALKPWWKCSEILLLKLPNPDIPEADGLALVAMRLEFD